jgi:hypothetical protein
MSGFPRSPRLVKGGIVVVDPNSAAVQRVIAMQYNPETVTRSFQVQAFGADGADRSEALRIKAPPVETVRVEAQIDATDQLEVQDRAATEVGIHPQLATLETILYPTSAQLRSNNALARSGTLEIVPMRAPLTLFVWSKERIIPMRLSELSVTEEAFDPWLNPTRAKVTLAMRVLSVQDLGFEAKGGGLFMAYLAAKESLAQRQPPATLAQLGIRRIT